MTKQEIISLFNKFGFFVVHRDKLRVWHDIETGVYGVEVGRYWHSCHVDTTDFIVLLIINENGHTRVQDFHDISLKEIID